jgi:hypothetical protein
MKHTHTIRTDGVLIRWPDNRTLFLTGSEAEQFLDEQEAAEDQAHADMLASEYRAASYYDPYSGPLGIALDRAMEAASRL